MFRKILGRRRPFPEREIEKSPNNDLYPVGQDLFDFAKKFEDRMPTESCDNHLVATSQKLIDDAQKRVGQKSAKQK